MEFSYYDCETFSQTKLTAKNIRLKGQLIGVSGPD